MRSLERVLLIVLTLGTGRGYWIPMLDARQSHTKESLVTSCDCYVDRHTGCSTRTLSESILAILYAPKGNNEEWRSLVLACSISMMVPVG